MKLKGNNECETHLPDWIAINYADASRLRAEAKSANQDGKVVSVNIVGRKKKNKTLTEGETADASATEANAAPVSKQKAVCPYCHKSLSRTYIRNHMLNFHH